MAKWSCTISLVTKTTTSITSIFGLSLALAFGAAAVAPAASAATQTIATSPARTAAALAGAPMTKAAYSAAFAILAADYQAAAQRFVDDQASEYAFQQNLRPKLDKALAAQRADLDAKDAASDKAVAALTKANAGAFVAVEPVAHEHDGPLSATRGDPQ